MKKIHLSFNAVAHTLHVTIGSLGVFFPVAMGWWHGQLFGSAAMILYAVLKEFIFDIHFEDPATSGGWWGSCKDFAGYLAGIWVANMILFLKEAL